MLENSGLIQKIGQENICGHINQALERARRLSGCTFLNIRQNTQSSSSLGFLHLFRTKKQNKGC